MKTHKLTVENRDVFGRKLKSLRASGVLPANIFGKDIKSKAIKVDRAEFNKVFSQAGETGIIELQVGKEISPVLVANIQTHPVTGEALHVDFRQVNMKEKIEAQVPIKLVGESQAEKDGLGIVVQQTDEVLVEALPMDLPESFEVDIAKLVELGSAIVVADLPSSDKVKILDEPEKIIVKVEEPQAEEEVVAPEPTEEEAASGSGEETKEDTQDSGDKEEEAPSEE